MSNPRLPTHSRNTSLGEEPQFASPLEARSPSSDFNIAFQASLEQQSSMDLGGSHVDIAGAGLGNLADELADAFSDSGDEAEDINEKGSLYNDDLVCENNSSLRNCDSRAKACGSDSIQLSTPAATHLEVHASQQRNHQRKTSDYDGSDYGSSSDFDDTGLSPSIIAKLDAVDALARRGAHDIGLQDGDIFTRVTGELRDLASQSSVESSTARLITAHAAIATHLTHQTRQIQGLAFSLLSPMAPSPSSDVVDDVVPLLISLAESVPRPSMVAYESLSALHSMTAELVRTLSYLSDTLHMSRQTTATATRRLRSARDLVAEIRRDDELREEGETWLARGNWGERLQRRECASVCGDVIGGFEAVCNGWRERLAAQERSVA